MKYALSLSVLLLLAAPLKDCPKDDCRLKGCPQGQACVMDDTQPEAKYVCVPIPEPTPEPTPTPTPEPTPTPTPEPTPTPTPTPNPTPTPEPTPTPGCSVVFPASDVSIVIKPYGKGYALTPVIQNRAWCTANGFPGRNQCPLRPESAPDRVACERAAIGGTCPIFKSVSCEASCPMTFDLWRNDEYHNINVAAGCPEPPFGSPHPTVAEAYWARPEGKGKFTACTHNDQCANPIAVDQ